ncbi:MAG TPA: archaemetzincin family Zn-dependent metalloprotease [Candidatus Acidoferrum sp.]
MNRIQLLPLGTFPGETLIALSAGLRKRFGVACEVLPAEPEPAFAFNFARQQYSSTEILASLMKYRIPGSERILGVAAVDLYIPILTFVFGEAQLRGSCAVVSFHRLRQEFYGLPANSTVLRERLLKEAVHELGHTLPLAHCEDYQCVMSPSHGVEWIDLKTSQFCTSCQMAVTSQSAGIARS